MTTDVRIETDSGGNWLEAVGNRWAVAPTAADDPAPDTAATATAITRSARTTLGASRAATVDEDAVSRAVQQDIQDDLAEEQVEAGTDLNDPGVKAWYAKFDQLQQLQQDRYTWGDHLAENPHDATVWTEMLQHATTTLGMTTDEITAARAADIRAKVAEVSARNLAEENRRLRSGALPGTKNATAARPSPIPRDPGELSRAFRDAVERDDRAAINRLSSAMGKLSRPGGWAEASDGSISEEIFR